MSLEGKTEEEIKSLERALLAEVEEKDGAAGNISLLRSLKWDDDLYWSVRDRLEGDHIKMFSRNIEIARH